MKKILRAMLIAGLLLSFTACTDKETSRAGIAGVPSAITGTANVYSAGEHRSDIALLACNDACRIEVLNRRCLFLNRI